MQRTNITAVWAAILLSLGLVYAQTPLDTLYPHHGRPIGVELVDLSADLVRYRLPGENLIRAYGRMAVHALKHRNGRAELISDYQTLAPDWTIGRVVELPSVDAAQGLVPVGTIEGGSRRRQLKQAVLSHGRFVVFETFRRSRSGVRLRARLYDYPSGVQPTFGQDLALISPELPEQGLLWSLGTDSIAIVGRRALVLGQNLRVNRYQLIYRDARTGADSALGRMAVAGIRRAGQPGYLKLKSASWSLPGLSNSSVFIATSTDEVRGLAPTGVEYLYQCSYVRDDLEDLQTAVSSAVTDAMFSQRMNAGSGSWNFCAVLEPVHPATVQALLARPGMLPLRRIDTGNGKGRSRDGRFYILIRPYRRGS